MSAGAIRALRKCWIEEASKLHANGHFVCYSPEQLDEVLRKGCLGPWPPDQSIAIAKKLFQQGIAVRKAKFDHEMRDNFGLVGEEAREAVLQILDGIPSASYEPPYKLEEPPGCPFQFWSRTLGCEV